MRAWLSSRGGRVVAPSEVPQQQLRPLNPQQLAQQQLQLQPPPPPPPQQQPDGELAALKSRLAQSETRSVQWAAQVSFDTSGPLGADWQPLHTVSPASGELVEAAEISKLLPGFPAARREGVRLGLCVGRVRSGSGQELSVDDSSFAEMAEAIRTMPRPLSLDLFDPQSLPDDDLLVSFAQPGPLGLKLEPVSDTHPRGIRLKEVLPSSPARHNRRSPTPPAQRGARKSTTPRS